MIYTCFFALLATVASQSIGDTGVTLAVLNETLPVANFSCGANRFKDQIGQLFNSTECRNLRDPLNVCCESHDKCYNDKLEKLYCDNQFCECLSVATDQNLCAVDGAGFCAAVRIFGQPVYDISIGLQAVSPKID